MHHMFGGEVTELVSKAYGDAYLTAHFEVSPPHCEGRSAWSNIRPFRGRDTVSCQQHADAPYG